MKLLTYYGYCTSKYKGIRHAYEQATMDFILTFFTFPKETYSLN